MTQADDFVSVHRHGLIRVAAAAPVGTVGDVDCNCESIRALAVEADAGGADVVVFPELSLSSYAIDDLFLQDVQLAAVEKALAVLMQATASLRPLLLVGAPVRRAARIYNCAIAIARGRCLGVVPKSFLPNYREYYEKRWFASGAGMTGLTVVLAGETVPFGTDLVFVADSIADCVVHAEICEDFWAATPPSTMAALAGATVLCNLSASNITIGKARERAMLAASQSSRAVAAYIYSAAGPGESTTDLAWDGHAMIHEMGECLAQSDRFGTGAGLLYADVDVQRIRLNRARNGTFNDAAVAADHPERRFRQIVFPLRPLSGDRGLMRPIERFPFVPGDPQRLHEDCYEAFNIQVEGLSRRIQSTGAKHLIIGISGGLDSTHALIVAAKACDRLGLPRSAIRAYTMPGFATSEGTKANAWALMRALGTTAKEIDIRPAAERMLADIGHGYAKGQALYDVTFENVQAGLRTDYLFRLANHHDGFVVGTGDLSELALGWCTYGVGDQMSHYAVNCGVPKTLIQYLIQWTVDTGQFDATTAATLRAVLDTEISPELVPADADGALQSTEARIGPYALNDFFLHYIARHGLPPSKVAFLAWHAWRDASVGDWPEGYPDKHRVAFDLETIRFWLRNFLFRFFQISQYKRSAIPNGPKLSSRGALSPRGDWRAPSDGTAKVWLAELDAALPPGEQAAHNVGGGETLA